MPATDATETVAPLSDADARMQRTLKLVVVGLGVLILVGLAAVIGRVIYLSSAAPAQPVAPVPDVAAEQVLQLPPDAQVRTISLSGNRLAVHYLAGAKEGVAVIDLKTGRTVSSVAVQRGAPRD
jgi:hypothetical protein